VGGRGGGGRGRERQRELGGIRVRRDGHAWRVG
jgi:hypothetical protein